MRSVVAVSMRWCGLTAKHSYRCIHTLFLPVDDIDITAMLTAVTPNVTTKHTYYIIVLFTQVFVVLPIIHKLVLARCKASLRLNLAGRRREEEERLIATIEATSVRVLECQVIEGA